MTRWQRIYRWLDDRMDLYHLVVVPLRHPVPRDVNWWYVFGSLTLTAFIVQVITGVVLAFAYVPSTEHAQESLRFITEQAYLGRVMRGMHFYGSTAMVVLILIHMTRVFLFGSFKFPREVNWLAGSFLLLLTLAMAFTGQLLRWDQDSFWGIVVLAEQAGKTPVIGSFLVQLVVAGQQVGAATLTRFFATHVFLIPAAMFLLLFVHLYLVIQRGISDPPRPGLTVEPSTELARYEHVLRERGVPFFPDVAWRDLAASTALVLGLLAVSVAFGPPPILAPADPTLVRTDPRPDWYFLPLFALLALVPPAAENVVILGVPIVVGAFLLALPFVAARGERHWRRRPWAVGAVLAGTLAGAVLLYAGIVSPWAPRIELADLPVSALPERVTRDLDATELRGAGLFIRQGCWSCHQVAGMGGLAGTDLTTVGDRLTREQLIIRIATGARGMPAYGSTLTPEQLEELVAFLETLRQRR